MIAEKQKIINVKSLSDDDAIIFEVKDILPVIHVPVAMKRPIDMTDERRLAHKAIILRDKKTCACQIHSDRSD